MKALKDSLKKIRKQVQKHTAPAAVVPLAPAPEPEPDFKQLFQDVTPLKPDRTYHPPHSRPSPHPRRRVSSNPVPAGIFEHMSSWFEPTETESRFSRPGQPVHTLKKLKAGHWPVSAELDLHGLNRHAAQDALAVFLHQARKKGVCVRIIHGKGFGSQGEPVLKRMTRNWLQQHPDVLAFCEASSPDGGSGALMVLLKRLRNEED